MKTPPRDIDYTGAVRRRLEDARMRNKQQQGAPPPEPPLPPEPPRLAEDEMREEYKDVIDQVRPHIQQMVRDFFGMRQFEINRRTRNVELASESPASKCYGRSDAKESQGAYRINEDVLGIGENGIFVGDGISGAGNNLCHMMGHTAKETALAMFRRWNTADPRPNSALIVEQMRMIPEIARQLLREELENDKTAARWLLLKRMQLRDFATTAELVYFSPMLEKIFIGHIGDSRTYRVGPDGRAENLVEPHKIKSMNILTSSVILAYEPEQFDIHVKRVKIGEKYFVITDGNYDTYERMYKGARYEDKVEEAAKHPNEKAVAVLQKTGDDCQAVKKHYDDRTAAVMEVLSFYDEMEDRETIPGPDTIDLDSFGG